MVHYLAMETKYPETAQQGKEKIKIKYKNVETIYRSEA